MEKIFVINPGSTSTKIAYFDGDQEQWHESLSHDRDALGAFDRICDQLDFRYDLICKALKDHGLRFSDLDAVAARGGPIAPLHSGAYEVDDAMEQVIRTHPLDQHASLLGALLANRIEHEHGIPSYIYDAVSVNEMLPVCRVSGVPALPRQALIHNLNMRAAALRLCRQNGWDYKEKTIIVAHLGGGITVSLHRDGTIIDMVSDEDGPFAPERAGLLPVSFVLDMIDRGEIDSHGVRKLIKGDGGLVAWLGTNDSRKVEEMISSGDEQAKLIYEAMAVNVAKSIGKLAPVANGKVDAIILTGGIAFSDYFTGMIVPMVDWIAPVTVMPGENEMQSLAEGVLRVLRGEETARTFPDKE
ncbi:MAG: butyrate kinase [Ruminococcaceae bacterium]|nr:butyrate kinase [Oscillospiraceae bacterium]